MEISNKYSYMRQENRIPRYRDFLHNTSYSNSNYRRERENYLYSINNNISTSFSSFDKINDKNLHRYNQENNIVKSTNGSRSRSRSPCFCGCHLNDECIYPPNHCIPLCHYDQTCTQYSNNIITKNEEIKKNDNLLNQIIYLKRNLKRVENELNRTKTEKDASDFYIKQLEKELSKLNMSNIVDPKKRTNVKMRDYGKYHDMLNKSFEVLDSVSNQCNDSRGQTKGGVNYYYDRQQDYNIVIDTQKKWLDSLSNSKLKNSENDYMNNINDEFKGSDKVGINKFSNSGYPDDNSKLNVFKYPEGYININDENSNDYINDECPSHNHSNNNRNNNNIFNIPNKNNKYIQYNPLYSNDFDNQREKRKNDSNVKTNNNLPPNQIKQKMNSMMNNKNNNILINDNSNEPKNNKSIPYPKKNSNNAKDIKIINENSNSYYPNKNKIGESGNNIKGIKNKENNEEDEEDKKEKEKNNILKKRYLVSDNNGNPIFIEGKRLLGMEILPIIGEDGKEELDENGNIIFIGPDGQPKTQEDLEPIILDNDLPLVNEENKPFLGIDGIIMVNRYGIPIIGPGELYDKDNKVVHGELGIFPTDKQGNLVKFNIPGESDINNDNILNRNADNSNINDNNYDNNYNKNDDDNDENKNYNKNDDDNEDINSNENDNENQKYNNINNSNPINHLLNKDSNNKYGPINKNENNNPKYNNTNNKSKNNKQNINYNKDNDGNKGDKADKKVNIKPWIGSDGRPVLDKKNNQIIPEHENKPIKGKGITILLDQSGMPVLNTIGEPILINKDGKPINLIEKEDNNMNNLKIYYPNLEKNYNIIKPNNNKKKNNKNDNMNNDNQQKRKFGINPFLEGNKNDYKYPKPNQNYQRKLNYKPISNTNYNQKEYSSSCFACDVGCAVSRSGYSPMTYSPYDNKIKRREVTPLKNQ